MAGRADLARAAPRGWMTTAALRSNEGPILQRGLTPMRSFVVEPMQYGRLFLAGDAAHIVPPTGAKGMNLAIADVRVLARALVDLLSQRPHRSARRLFGDLPAARLARAALLVVDDGAAAPLSRRRCIWGALQLAELEYLVRSQPAQRALAENYVGLPFSV